MADIGPITAKIVATASGMASGLADAAKRLKDTTGKMVSDTMKAGAAAGLGFGKELAKGVAIGGGIKLFEGGVAAFGKLTELFTGGAARMAELGKAARQAGADVAGFQAVVESLGGDTGSAVEGVVKLKEAIGKALVEGQTDAFERLGLDPAGLLGGRADEVLATVAGRLRELGGGVAEARAGVALFGDKFKDLRPILDDGGEHIRRTADDLRKFGAAFGEGDFLQARDWERAMNQFSLLWKGLQNEIGKGLLPLLTEASARIGSLADHGVTFKGLGDAIFDLAERAATWAGGVYDAWADTDRVTAAWDLLAAHLKTVIVELSRFMYVQWAGAALAFTKLLPFGGDKAAVMGATLLSPALAELDRQRERARADLDIALGEAELLAFAGGAGSGAVADFFAGAGARRAAAAAADPLVKAGQDLFRLWEEGAERMGKALEGPVDKFREALKQVKALSALKEAWLFGPPVEGGGVGGITDAQALTLAGAFNQLKGAFGAAPGYNPAAAMLEGSREAYSAVQAFRQSATRESVEEALKRILQQQLEQEREQLRVGREVAAAAKKLANNLVPRGID